jgi:hypothetical protein
MRMLQAQLVSQMEQDQEIAAFVTRMNPFEYL